MAYRAYEGAKPRLRLLHQSLGRHRSDTPALGRLIDVPPSVLLGTCRRLRPAKFSDLLDFAVSLHSQSRVLSPCLSFFVNFRRYLSFSFLDSARRPHPLLYWTWTSGALTVPRPLHCLACCLLRVLPFGMRSPSAKLANSSSLQPQ